MMVSISDCSTRRSLDLDLDDLDNGTETEDLSAPSEAKKDNKADNSEYMQMLANKSNQIQSLTIEINQYKNNVQSSLFYL